MTTPDDPLNHCAHAAKKVYAESVDDRDYRHLWRNVAQAVLAAQHTHQPHIPIAAVRALASGRAVAEVADEYGVEVELVREVEGMVGRRAEPDEELIERIAREVSGVRNWDQHMPFRAAHCALVRKTIELYHAADPAPGVDHAARDEEGDDDHCDICGEDLTGAGSHYHCANCGELSSMMGHYKHGAFTCTARSFVDRFYNPRLVGGET